MTKSRRDLYLQAFRKEIALNTKAQAQEILIRQLEEDNLILRKEIGKIAMWFIDNAEELIEEGSTCDNAVRWLNYFVLEKDAPMPASPDVIERDID